jgi:hypothetical protein
MASPILFFGLDSSILGRTPLDFLGITGIGAVRVARVRSATVWMRHVNSTTIAITRTGSLVRLTKIHSLQNNRPLPYGAVISGCARRLGKTEIKPHGPA